MLSVNVTPLLCVSCVIVCVLVPPYILEYQWLLSDHWSDDRFSVDRLNDRLLDYKRLSVDRISDHEKRDRRRGEERTQHDERIRQVG